VKLNWDAALHKQSKTMGVGVVIRDVEGVFALSVSMDLVCMDECPPPICNIVIAEQIISD
jgi:hypothetical protein